VTDDPRSAQDTGDGDGSRDTSRAALRALFDAALDAIIVVDDSARVVDANPAAAELCGEPRDALIGRWIGDFTPPGARDRSFQRWSEFMAAGARRDTGRLVRADGSEREVEYAASANFLPGRHLWMLHDVTERNEALREARFHADLLDHVDAAVVAVDLEGRVTHWNAAAERLYCVPRDQAIGRYVEPLVAAEGEEEKSREVARRVSRGLSWEGEFKVRRRGRDPVSAWVLDAPIRAPGGGVAGYVGVAVDLSERHKAELELERSRATMEAILGSALDAVVAMDLEGRTVEWNRAAEKTFGYTREEALGTDLLGLVGTPEVIDELKRQLARYRETGTAWSLGNRIEVTARRADGGEFPVELSVNDAKLPDGSTIFAAYARDITERRRTNELLAARAQQQAAIAELGQRALEGGALGELMQHAVATIAGTLSVDVVALFELREDERELITRASVGVPEKYAAVGRMPLGTGPIVGALETREPVIVQDWRNEEGLPPHPAVEALGIASLVHAVVGGGEQGRPWGVLTITSTEPHRFSDHDVNFAQAVANVLAGAIERRRTEDAVRHRALHDDLTGLPNRALFLDRLEHALAQMDRRGTTVAVIFIDIDQFKVVNDSLGHQAGDLLLQAIVPRLSAALRPGDTLARFAGDEFVVLCEGIADEQGAVTVGERVLDCFAEPYYFGDREQFVSASLGVAVPRRSAQDAEALIRDADTAMYRAKERGRARLALFDEHMRVRTLVRMRIDHDLRRAVLGEDMYVHYQPIVDLEAGEVAGFEALMRWRHPSRGDLSPVDFIPIAEESGMIGFLGRWVLEQAAQQAVRWEAVAGAGARPIGVSVNLSPRQFGHDQLADEVAEVLAATGLAPQRLQLEITESLLIDETDTAIDELHALKDLGVNLVIDDFGTGYSSLSYLERFPLDGLKIDRSFVAALSDGGSAPIVDAIVSMAHSLDLLVTAEGVETGAQVHPLRRVGCEYGQGWYFGRPGPADALDRLISSGFAG
jgi:diguanylate cyclase (GGDEF)-like protein/PAS domain S-box-containing protein